MEFAFLNHESLAYLEQWPDVYVGSGKPLQNRKPKKRRKPPRRNRRPSRPEHHIGRRTNNHLNGM